MKVPRSRQRPSCIDLVPTIAVSDVPFSAAGKDKLLPPHPPARLAADGVGAGVGTWEGTDNVARL